MPISALPCKYGIGSFGDGAYMFVDFLKSAGQKYWQVLPLVQTGFGDSPYQSVADNSGNPYFIDLEILHSEGLITKRELQANIEKSPRIDYGKLYEMRYSILRKAFSRFNVKKPSFVRWCREGKFADYACFMALKQKFPMAFYDWPNEYKYRNELALKAFCKENANEILFWQFLQYEFDKQWSALKKYANSKGIKIIGDLPLYVATDSVDVWANPELFLLDSELHPEMVAGVPPDYFCEDGQLWGNPIYNYDNHARDGFSWWKNRIARATSLYDYVRIDHFRGLDRYWAVPAGSETARFGEWYTAPGTKIFEGVDTSSIIAEDLGVIDEGVINLLNATGLPGMKVLDFAFGGDFKNPYLPWNVKENSIYYTGTHDNDTALGLIEKADENFKETIFKQVAECFEYLEIYRTVSGKYDLVDAFIDIVYASRANVAIVPMHDVLCFSSDYRINEPSTVGNWTVRYRRRLFTDTASNLLKRKAKRFER